MSSAEISLKEIEFWVFVCLWILFLDIAALVRQNIIFFVLAMSVKKK